MDGQFANLSPYTSVSNTCKFFSHPPFLCSVRCACMHMWRPRKDLQCWYLYLVWDRVSLLFASVYVRLACLRVSGDFSVSTCTIISMRRHMLLYPTLSGFWGPRACMVSALPTKSSSQPYFSFFKYCLHFTWLPMLYY